ncbi:hypothetical protein ACF06X_33260 [Streptomyces sp. NPDC015346]|uniref:hypothetical protein n=1 Tax=Streptomyces sp. NPDC015346 TaxID=3364954 RepID=UPI0036FA0E01
MRHVRGVGMAAAGVAAVALLAGCGDGGDAKAGDGPSPTPSATTTSPAVEEPAEPTFADTPAGRLDKLAYENGWLVGDGSESAPSQYVVMICESMDTQNKVGTDPGEWIAERTEGDQAEVLKAGMPELCPRWSAKTLKALGGDHVWSYDDGTWTVKAKPVKPEFGADEGEIAPGTYRTTGDLKDCYWERTAKDGTVLENKFATSAQEITVTIRATDGQFKTERCGRWRIVK